MKTFVLCAAAPALVLTALFQQEEEARPGLKRVAPVPLEEETGTPIERVLQKDMNEDEWRAWLSAPDLEARERSYEDLVRRARIDVRARAFLERLSRDEANPELAWTARLALREVGNVRTPSVFGRERFDRELEGILEELWATSPAFPMTPERMRVFRLPQGSADGSAKHVQVQQTPDGARIVITETVDGEEQTREYEGESLESILEQNPELRDEVGIQGTFGGPNDFRFEFGLPDRRWSHLLPPLRYGDRSQPQVWRLEIEDPDRLDDFFAPTDPSRPVRTDKLGVRVQRISEARAEELGLENGLLVLSTFPGTIAHLLGVRSGDVLVSLNGKPMDMAEAITQSMRERKPDEGVQLEWIDELGERYQRSWDPEPEKD